MLRVASLLAFVESPAMLGWLAAASAPLVIHLLNRRKFRESSWAAMQFLLAAVRKNSRRIQLEQWLLLALRTLLIIAFVLAAAQPGLKSIGLTAPAAERTFRVLVVDGSFSMAYKPTGDRSYFEQVKQSARRIVDKAREGDAYGIVVLGSPSRAATSGPILHREETLALIDELRQTHGAGDLASCLNEIDRVLARAHDALPQIRRREVHFLTDLGRYTWEPSGEGRRKDSLDEFQARAERWGSDTSLVVVDVGSADAENTAVVELAAEEPFGVVGLPTTLRAVVRHYGRTRRAGVTATLTLDGRKVDERTIDVEPGGDVTIVFDSAAAGNTGQPGRRLYEVALSPDRLEVDDRRRLTLDVKSHLKVLVVHDRAPTVEAEFGLHNLEDALRLRPGAEALPSSPIVAELAAEPDVRGRDLTEFDAVWAVDVRRFDDDTARRLHEYVKQGGGFVAFLGRRVDAEFYNTRLAQGPLQLLPARLGPAVEEPQYRLNPLKYEHPLLAEFRGREQGGLLNTPVYRYHRLDTSQHPTTRRVLEFLNEQKDPFLVESPLGSGRLLAVAASLESSWTTLSLSPGFVPLVQEMLSYSVGGRAAAAAYTVGEPLSGTFRRTTSTADVAIDVPAADATGGGGANSSTVDDDANAKSQNEKGGASATKKSRAAAEVAAQGENYRWTYAGADVAGFYAAHLSGPPPTIQRYAVNVDPGESDPAKLAAVKLTDRQWSDVRFYYGTEVRDFDEPQASFTAVGEANPWHRQLLFFALAAALVETWWAGRIGRRRL